jgi:hypothetical protein
MERKEMKVSNIKLRAWIKEKDLMKINIFLEKPKEKCVEVEIGIIPIKKKK